jgi:hypothetical protein
MAARARTREARTMPAPLSLQPRVLLDIFELDPRQVVLVEQLLQEIATLCHAVRVATTPSTAIQTITTAIYISPLHRPVDAPTQNAR